MNPDQISAVYDLVSGKIEESEFCARYGRKPSEFPAEAEQLMSAALANHDADTVEIALILGFRFGFRESIVDQIHTTLVQPWHVSHENMIGILQKMKNPGSVTHLRAAIELKPKLLYLDHDDYGSYYKKCLWALADIGTPEAITTIEKFVGSGDPVLREQASYRLQRLGSIG